MNEVANVSLLELSRPKQWPTLTRRELKDSGFPVYGANGKIGFTDQYTHEEPTIIIGCRGSCGEIHITEPRAYVTGNAMALDHLDTRRVDQSYLVHFLRKRGFADIVSGSSQPQITRQGLSRLDVPLPALDVQRRIATVLDKANAIRRKREQSLALADDFLRSVFLDIFGNPSTNPKGYPVMDFGSILLMPLRNGISPSSKGNVSANVLTLSAITGDRFKADQSKKGKFLEPISSKDTVNRSDFYICRGNGSPDLIGKGYFADRDIGGTAFPDTMIAAKPDPGKVTKAYLEKLWNSPFIRNQIREAARTTNGTFKINQTAAGAVKMPIPALSDQKRYQTIVDQVGQAMSKLAYGDDLFPALSQRAFRGEL